MSMITISSLFNFSITHSVVIEAPLKQVWYHAIDVDNWPNWQEPYGKCCLERGFIGGGKILVWDKEGNSLVPIDIVRVGGMRVEPRHVYVLEEKISLGENVTVVKQITEDSFEPLNDRETKVTRRVTIKGPLAFLGFRHKSIVEKKATEYLTSLAKSFFTE